MKVQLKYCVLASSFIYVAAIIIYAAMQPIDHWINSPNLWGIYAMIPTLFAPLAFPAFILLYIFIELDK